MTYWNVGTLQNYELLISSWLVNSWSCEATKVSCNRRSWLMSHYFKSTHGMERAACVCASWLNNTPLRGSYLLQKFWGKGEWGNGNGSNKEPFLAPKTARQRNKTSPISECFIASHLRTAAIGSRCSRVGRGSGFYLRLPSIRARIDT